MHCNMYGSKTNSMNIQLMYMFALMITFRGDLSLEEKIESKRILVTDSLLQSQQISALTQRLSALENTVTTLQSDTQNLRTENQNLKATVQSLQTSNGMMYVRWGRKECSTNGTELVYSGYTAGSSYRTGGGVATTLCLPQDPTWGKQTTPSPNFYNTIEGSEYNTDFFGSHTLDEDIPCAVCRTLARSSVVMIPGRVSCYPGMSTEYHGYLAGGDNTSPSDYICIDENPDVIIAGEGNDNSGRLYYPIRALCGPLPCPPYHNNNFVACSVCSK